jgi:hypothetical protein
MSNSPTEKNMEMHEMVRDTLIALKRLVHELTNNMPDELAIFALVTLVWGYYVNAPPGQRQKVQEHLDREWARVREDAAGTVAALMNAPDAPESGRLNAMLMGKMRREGRRLRMEEIAAIVRKCGSNQPKTP